MRAPGGATISARRAVAFALLLACACRDQLGRVARFSTPVPAKGRIFVAADGAVRALVR